MNVCLNAAGVWVGIHRDPQLLVDTLRAMRRQVDISTEVGVVHDIRLQVGAAMLACKGLLATATWEWV